MLAANYNIFPNTRFAYLPTFTRTPGGSFSSLSRQRGGFIETALPFRSRGTRDLTIGGDRPPGNVPDGMSKIKFRSFPQNAANYSKTAALESSKAVILSSRRWVYRDFYARRRGMSASPRFHIYCSIYVVISDLRYARPRTAAHLTHVAARQRDVRRVRGRATFARAPRIEPPSALATLGGYSGVGLGERNARTAKQPQGPERYYRIDFA